MKVIDCIELIDREDISIRIPDEYPIENEQDNGLLLLSHSLSRTGAPLQLYELTKVLLNLGYTPYIYSPFEGDLIEDYSEMGVITICGVGPVFDEKWLELLAGVFDTIFVNTLDLVQSIRILAPITKRLFWWIHENSYLFNANKCNSIPSVPSLRVLAASDKAKEHVKRFIGIESTVINVCTCDLGAVEPESKDKAVFLWAGSVDFNKAPQVFLEAILKLSPYERSLSEFYIFGKKNTGNEYVELIENFAIRFDNIHFMDAVTHEELMQVIDIVDAVVVSSIEETTSMIAVESLMKERVVICSDGCGVAGYLKDTVNGLIFPSGNSSALADKIRLVIEDRNMAYVIGKAGRTVYEQNYSYDIFEKNIEKLLHDTHIINENMNGCSGCGSCVLSCPVKAITMKSNEKGFLYPDIEKDKCVSCGKCRSVCPVNRLEIDKEDVDECEVYAFRINDRNKRMQSQSGGAFSAFAEQILKEDGIVYGVGLAESFDAVYIELDDLQDLYKIKGSKYIQANAGDVFSKVKCRLDEGRKVLFSGTSCYVDGLLRFLGNVNTENLYTCDLVCHGVPSPQLFRDYIDYQKRNRGMIRNYNFRNKSIRGWHSHLETWECDDKVSISSDYTDVFYTNNAHRECCYSCRYASLIKPADITIGDFWGIENVRPEMDDNLGVSLVITRNKKGRDLLDTVKDAAEVKGVEKEDCLQPNLVAPTARPGETDLFWEEYKYKPIRYILQSYSGNRDNRRFNNEMNSYLNDERRIAAASEYLDRNNINVTGICGDIWDIRLFMNKMKDDIKTDMVVVNVFGDTREWLNVSSVTVDEYKLKHNNGKIIIMDETHCESYITKLVNSGISPLNILPVSYILDEEV